MTPLLEISRDSTRSLREAAERIGRANGSASAADLDELIGEILDYPGRMRRLYRSLLARIASGELRQPAALNDARRAFAEVFDAHREVQVVYRDRAAGFGSAVANLAALRAVVAEMDALRQQIFSRWTELDPDAGRRALESHARGETFTLDEVFGELPSPPRA